MIETRTSRPGEIVICCGFDEATGCPVVYRPSWPQYLIHTSPQFYKCHISGYGGGKTLGGCVELVRSAVNHPGSSWWDVSPTYDLAIGTTLEHYTNILESSSIDYDFNQARMELKFANGSKIRLRSGEIPRKLVGANIWGARIDEPFILAKEVYEKVLARIRVGSKNFLLFTGTPEGVSNWGADLIAQHRGDPRWLIIQAKTTDNPLYSDPDCSYVQNLLAEYSSELVEAYLNGQFVSLNTNLAYGSFRRANNVVPTDYREERDIWIACDWNVSPMTGVCVYQEGDLDFVFGEIRLNNATVGTLADEIRRRFAGHKGKIVITGDPTGKNRSVHSPYGNFEILRNELRDMSVRIDVPQVMRVVDSLNLVNSRLCNANKQVRTFVDPKCESLIRDFERVTRLADGSIDKKSDPALTHVSDAFRYYCSNCRMGARYARVTF